MPTPRPKNGTAVLERPPVPVGAAAPQQAAQVTEEPRPQRRATGEAEYDLAVLGAGPGGYVAAIRATQLGLKVAIIEKGHLGGTCLNVGCIPTKAMLASVEALSTARKGKEYGFTAKDVQPDYEAMVNRRDKVVEQLRGGVGMLMKRNGIDTIQGAARFRSSHEIEVSANGSTRRLTAANVLIATGSVPSRPPIPGSDLEGVVNSDQLLNLPSIPKSLAVIGAGAVGLEWGDIFAELGSKVTVLEMVDRLLPPADAEVAQELARTLKKKGFDLRTGVAVQGIERKNGQLSVSHKKAGDDSGKAQAVEAEVVLVATGRWPYTEGLGLEHASIQLERRAISVDDQMRTRTKNVFAIGDVTPGPALAHVASKGGEVAAEVIAGHKAKMDYRVIPSCVYTSPEVAWVGLTQEEAEERYGEVKVGKYQFRGMGRAMASSYRDGFVKVIADARYGEILGVHMIGAHVTDLIAEPTLGMSMEATVEEIFHAVHAHPTLPEAFMEASLDAWDRAIHK
jgi:dihydrolipoamide dehydrogenase